MLAPFLALIGIAIAVVSITFTAIQGAQVAVIGASFILLAIYLKLPSQ